MGRYGSESLEVLTSDCFDRQVGIGAFERIDSQSVESRRDANYPGNVCEVANVQAVNNRPVRRDPQRMYCRFKHIASRDGRLSMKSSAKSSG